jgi:hypothetical protein
MKLLAAVKESWYKQRGHWWERRVLKPRDLALRRLTPQRKGALRPQYRSRSRSRYLATRKQE